MKSKKGFLLIELFFSISAFMIFCVAISICVNIALKQKDLAVKRLSALNYLLNYVSASDCKNENKPSLKQKNIAQLNFDLEVYNLNCKEKLILKKIKTRGFALGKQDFRISLIC